MGTYNLKKLLVAFLIHVQSINHQENYNEFAAQAYTLAQLLGQDNRLDFYLNAIEKTVCDTSEYLNLSRLTAGFIPAQILLQLDYQNILRTVEQIRCMELSRTIH